MKKEEQIHVSSPMKLHEHLKYMQSPSSALICFPVRLQWFSSCGMQTESMKMHFFSSENTVLYSSAEFSWE